MTARARSLVAAFAVTQTVGYGVLYYAFAVLLQPMAVELHASTAAVTGALTCPAEGDAGTVPLHRQRKSQAHRLLQMAARRLTAQQGLDHVTVEAIASAAGVSTRTFFNYFASKEAAVVDAPPDTWRRLAAALSARPDEGLR